MTAPAEDLPDHVMNELLIRVARAEDVVAFERLFRHFGPRIKAYMSRGGGAARAEELMQETMLAVWKKANLYSPDRGNVASWIFTIARNQRIDAFRRDGRVEFDPNDPAFVPEPEPAADQTIAIKQESVRVRQALRALPQEQAEVLRMSFYEDRSQSAIATALKVPLGTVKSRMRLGFIKLRALVGQTGDMA